MQGTGSTVNESIFNPGLAIKGPQWAELSERTVHASKTKCLEGARGGEFHQWDSDLLQYEMLQQGRSFSGTEEKDERLSAHGAREKNTARPCKGLSPPLSLALAGVEC